MPPMRTLVHSGMSLSDLNTPNDTNKNTAASDKGSKSQSKTKSLLTVIDNSDTDPEEEPRDEDLGLCDLPWGPRWLAFVDNVSIGGLKYAVDPRTAHARRIIWSIFVLVGVGFMIYQIYERCTYFLSYPKVTNAAYYEEQALRFPTVTLCNENYVVASRAAHNGFGNLVPSIYPPIPDTSFVPNFTDYGTLLQDLRDTNHDWRETWYYWSPVYDYQSWLYSCTYNGRACGESDIQVVYTTMGYCLQFNGPAFDHETRIPGVAGALSLVLNAEQWQYMYSLTRGAGFRVLVHSHDKYPGVDIFGFRVSPGQAIVGALSLTKLSLLPAPHGDCADRQDYDEDECAIQCSMDYVADQCNCRFWFSDVSGYPACDPEQEYACAFGAVYYFGQNYRKGKFDYLCKCPINCNSLIYDIKLSSNKLSDVTMARIAEQHFLTRNCSNSSGFPDNCYFTADFNATLELLHNNVVDIEIYFNTLKVEELKEIPAYNVLALLCDIGGAMGLILGSSLLTLGELTEFLVFLFHDIIYFKISQCYFRKKRKVNPVS